MPATLELVGVLRADGLPAVVSGAGPTVLVFTDASQQRAVAGRCPEGWAALTVPIDRYGARVDLPE
jgi:homoserine kinase